MDAQEFYEVCAYLSVEPQGTAALELLFAQLCQCVVAAAGVKNTEIKKFMPITNNIIKLAGQQNAKAFDAETAYERFSSGFAGRTYRG